MVMKQMPVVETHRIGVKFKPYQLCNLWQVITLRKLSFFINTTGLFIDFSHRLYRYELCSIVSDTM